MDQLNISGHLHFVTRGCYQFNTDHSTASVTDNNDLNVNEKIVMIMTIMRMTIIMMIITISSLSLLCMKLQLECSFSYKSKSSNLDPTFFLNPEPNPPNP